MIFVAIAENLGLTRWPYGLAVDFIGLGNLYLKPNWYMVTAKTRKRGERTVVYLKKNETLLCGVSDNQSLDLTRKVGSQDQS